MRRFLPFFIAALVVSSTARADECVSNETAVISITASAIETFGIAPEITLHYTDERAKALIAFLLAIQSTDDATTAEFKTADVVDVYIVKGHAAYMNFKRGDCTAGGASMPLETFLRIIGAVEKTFT